MTYLRYIIAPGYGAYLGHLFHSLVQGGKPDSEALAILNRLIANDSTISPPLPPGSQLRLIANTGLVVEAADGSIYSAMSFYIPRVALPIDQPAAVEAEVIQASDLDRAIKWLAAKLRQERIATFAKYQAECIEKFGISGRDYKSHVWPNAREEAGLERKAKAGRKKK